MGVAENHSHASFLAMACDRNTASEQPEHLETAGDTMVLVEDEIAKYGFPESLKGTRFDRWNDNSAPCRSIGSS